MTGKEAILAIAWELRTSHRREESWGGVGSRGAGRSRWDGAGWAELLICAPEPRHFWCPEGLVCLWFPSWGFRFYWERPAWLCLFPYFCFCLVRNISCFQNQLKINQSRGIFIFHFIRADPFQCPWSVLCPRLWRTRGRVLYHSLRVQRGECPPGSHQIELGWAVAWGRHDPPKAGINSSWDSGYISQDTKTVVTLSIGRLWSPASRPLGPLFKL